MEVVEGGSSRRPDKKPRVEGVSPLSSQHADSVPRSSSTWDLQDQSYLERDPCWSRFVELI